MVPVQSEDPDDAVRSVLRGLAASARQANLTRTGVIEDALRARAEHRVTPEQRSAAVSAAHQVAGSAGTFGHGRASALAVSLEQWFKRDGDGVDGEGSERDGVDDDDGLTRARRELDELWADLQEPHQDEE